MDDRIVGRGAEIIRLEEALTRASAGWGSAVIIEGEPGIGKSVLLDAVAEEARARGSSVLKGGADELERGHPFRAIASALALDESSHRAGADIARQLTDPVAAEGDRSYQLVEGVVAFVEEATRQGPIVLAIEDIHWADVATLRALHALTRTAAQLPLLLVATMRPAHERPELQKLLGRLPTDALIHLPPLDDASACVIAERITSAPPGPRLRAQIERAGGNPLYVTELVRALQQEGLISITNDGAETEVATMPPGLRLTILRRLSFLAPATIGTLRLAAILGSSFSPLDLAAVTHRPVADSAKSLDDAVRGGVIIEMGDRLMFRHELIRAAVIDDMPLADRKGLHRQTAAGLADIGAAPARVAEHMYLGAEPGDREAVGWLRRAAADAMARSPSIAVDLLERALTLVPPRDHERRDIVVDLVQPLVWSGRADRAEQLAGEVLSTPLEPADRVGVHVALAGAVGFQGNLGRAAEELERAASVDEAAAEDRARPAASAAYLRTMLGDPTGAERARAALASGRAVGSRFAQAMAMQTLAIAAAGEGRGAEAVQLARDAAALGDTVAAEERTWIPYLLPGFWLASALLDTDRFAEAEEAIAEGRRRAEELGVSANLAVFEWLLALVKHAAGAWDDALAAANAAFALSEETLQRAGTLVGHGVRSTIAFHRGDSALARGELAEAEQEIAQRGPRVGTDLIVWMRALIDEAGGASPGHAMLDAVWEGMAAVRFLFTYRLVAPDVVRFAVRRGDVIRARAIVMELEEGARRLNVASAEGVALRCRAIAESDRDAAIGAVEAYRRSPRIVDLALACQDAARLATAKDAVALLEEALEIFVSVDARRSIAQVETALRALGARPRKRSTQQRAKVGWEALTKTEREVVGLAAEGLTNRQIGERLFVSRRTVETHLGHVFQKLGIATRVQLAAEVVRRLG